jgi:triphosphoribosyl-dephospho-CoA synthetase
MGIDAATMHMAASAMDRATNGILPLASVLPWSLGMVDALAAAVAPALAPSPR